MRQLPFKFGKVASDDRCIESSEDRFLRLTIEQEAECRVQEALRFVLAIGQPQVRRAGDPDTMSCFASFLMDDHFEFERVSLTYAPDIDNVSLLALS